MSIKDGRWLGVFPPTDGVVSEQLGVGQGQMMSFGGSAVEVPPGQGGIVPFLAPMAGSLSPWTDAKPDDSGQLQLPEYDSEWAWGGDTRKWRPGDFTVGMDNIQRNAQGNAVKEWGGQKVGYIGNVQTADLDPFEYPENVQNLMKVPHMPGQPIKEMFARLKAVEPRIFEDPDFLAVQRDLPEEWRKFIAYTRWAEECGINTEQAPSEWHGHELECTPAVYVTLRPDTVSICVGIARGADEVGNTLAGDAEYDFLEYLYAKDQEGKVIQVTPYKSMGVERISFAQYSFVPPKGTSSITPYACFKIRGVWEGDRIPWDRDIANPDMQWFTDMSVQERLALGDPDKIDVPAGERPRPKKTTKQLPKLWPENSYEGNAAKARAWDQMH